MLGESLIVLMSLLYKLIKIFQEELHCITIIFLFCSLFYDNKQVKKVTLKLETF